MKSIYYMMLEDATFKGNQAILDLVVPMIRIIRAKQHWTQRQHWTKEDVNILKSCYHELAGLKRIGYIK